MVQINSPNRKQESLPSAGTNKLLPNARHKEQDSPQCLYKVVIKSYKLEEF